MLFDKDLAFRHLQQEEFGLVHNTRRVHGFSDQELRDRLAAWLEQGILHQYDDWYPKHTTVPWYGLTAKGGTLWESERTPIWSLYASPHWAVAKPGTQAESSVYSPSKVTGRTCLETLCRVNHCEDELSQAQAYRRRGFLLPWRLFPYYVEWQIVTTDHSDIEADWAFYHACLLFWQNVEELQKFLPVTTCS